MATGASRVMKGRFGLSDIEPEIVDPTQPVNPILTQVAAAMGEEAPVVRQQRRMAAEQGPSLRDIYQQARAAEEAKGVEERKPFKWNDLSSDQKKDTLLRLGLNLMQHSQSGIGLSGIGKAGAETLSFLDELQEKGRVDKAKHSERAAEEGMRLAQLAGMESDDAARARQLDQGDRQVLPGAEGYTLANLATGEATPITAGGEPVRPAASAKNSAFNERVELLKQIGMRKGMSEDEATEYAANEALRNRTHVDPGTYASLIRSVRDSYDSAYQLKRAAEAAGMSEQDFLKNEADKLIQHYQGEYGYGLSDFGGSGNDTQPAANPFIQP